ncbi:hypothetical protein BSKO_00461 [Bryopsis sp. KO-2023]|nr:hypothetical protein BSKO_00461 [Bryopsis sp. KO-2023]
MQPVHISSTTFHFQACPQLSSKRRETVCAGTQCCKRRIALPIFKRQSDDFPGSRWEKSLACSMRETGSTGVTTDEVDIGILNGQENARVNCVKVDLQQTGATATGLEEAEGKDSLHEERDQPPQDSEVVLGRIMLCVVAALWGTYAPALKYLYSLPGPPSPAVLTAVRSIIGAGVLLAGSKLFKRNSPDGEGDYSNSSESNWWSTSGAEAPQGSLRSLLTWSSGSLIISGLELGLWNFLASAAQTVGLEFTTATRTAFLIQSTALLTPVIATLAGDRLPLTGWLGCAIGLVGSLLITFEGKGGALVQDVSVSSSGAGELLVLWAALMYALNTVRLGTLAKKYNPLDLTTSKTVVLAVAAIAWALWDCGGVVMDGKPIVTLWAGYGDWRAWLILIWTALGPGALATFLQTTAQNSVRPAQAQVFVASTPFWSALIAGSFLSGEAMGSWGWFGGIIIVCGGLLSTLDFEPMRTKGKG